MAKVPFKVYGPLALVANGSVNVETLAADRTLLISDAHFQKFDPAGARDLTLPPEQDSKGLWFVITNAANGAEDITIENDAAATVVVLSRDEQVTVVCDGTTWVHMGIATIALS